MSVTMLNVPVGTILDFAGNRVPSGYLECKGQAVSRTQYSELFSVIGTTWGSGDGSTTFNIPDFRGRCSIGCGFGNAAGATDHPLASRGGDERLQSHAHGHSLTLPAHIHGGGSWVIYDKGGWSAEHGYGAIVVPNGSDYANTCLRNSGNWQTGGVSGNLPSINGSISSNGSGWWGNMPPYAAVGKIIRY